MAKKSKIKSVETLTHEEATRKNIPSAEHPLPASFGVGPSQPPVIKENSHQ